MFLFDVHVFWVEMSYGLPFFFLSLLLLSFFPHRFMVIIFSDSLKHVFIFKLVTHFVFVLLVGVVPEGG